MNPPIRVQKTEVAQRRDGRRSSDVCFARKSELPGALKSSGESLLLFGCMAAWGLWSTIILQLRTALGVGWVISLAVLPAVLAATWWARGFLRCRRELADLPEYEQPEYEEDPNSRIVCVGRPEWIVQHGGLVDRSFEPIVFHNAGATWSEVVRSDGRGCAVYFILFPLLWALIALLFYWLFDLRLPLIFSFPMYAAIVATFAVVEYLVYPTYYRIVPGRLDVLRFSNLPGGTSELTSFDLRMTDIIVNMVRGYCVIHGSKTAVFLPFRLAWYRRRVGYSLLLAAISTHEPPPLPEDELIG